MTGPYWDFRKKFQQLAQEAPEAATSEKSTDWEPVITIGTAAKMVSLSVSALRKYEKEGLLMYNRSESGRRMLCRADVKRIKMIKHLINDLGLNMEGIRRLLALLPCWDLKQCAPEDRGKCRAVQDTVQPCWMINKSECRKRGLDCRQCEVYRYGAYCAVSMKLLLLQIDDVK
jgi:MerR family transcriptional regulator/heat shock protein HspR